jgi:hypothetical protein
VRFNESVPRVAIRLLIAAVGALLCVAAIAGSTVLLTGTPIGAADNGDGKRLYCGAGLVPNTADGRSNWVGGVVMEFTRGAPCTDPVPSSALPILRIAAAGISETWSLARLGWAYAVLAAAVTAVAAWAATGRRALHVAVIVPALLPLVDPDFTRFFLSTFSEPAGLLGAYALACGIAALSVTTPRQRSERVVAMILTACGGALAATAKPAYLPLLLIAVLACATASVPVTQWRRRFVDLLPGVLLAALTCAAVVGPIGAALAWQARAYPTVNAHNIIFTTLLPEAGPAAAAEVGLPIAAAQHAGHGYYGPTGDPLDPDSIPGWQDAIGNRPAVAQAAADRALVERPTVLLRATGVAMQATLGADLSYLPETPFVGGASGPLQIVNSPAMGKDVTAMREWLDAMALRCAPSLLAAAGMIAGIASLRVRGPLGGFLRVAGAAGAAAVGLAVMSVLGDGYYEIAKHMWLAAYLLGVTLVALILATTTALLRRS